jgi:phosphoglucomutase
MKFFLNDGWIAVRPSGTEPKIKFYIASVGDSLTNCEEKIAKFTSEIDSIVNG